MTPAAAALPSSTDIGVVGAGTMGRGIARVAAAAGHQVILTDANPDAAANALEEIRNRLDRDVERERLTRTEADRVAARIEAVPGVEAMETCGLVIEAIVEDLGAKHAVFEALEAATATNTILATNTSSLSVADIATAVAGAGRVVGMHFFNPAPVLPLVEVVAATTTSPDVVAATRDTAAAWGKTPVVCTDTPGFIVNRVARPFYLESIALLEGGEGSPPEIDAAFRGAGFRMGPFELLDLIGIDVNLAVSKSVHAQLGNDPRIPPSALQQSLVDDGRLGRKTGRGFYGYPPGRLASTTVEPIEVETIRAIGDSGHAFGLAQRLNRAAPVSIEPSDGGRGRIEIDGLRIYPAPVRRAGAATIDVVSDWSTADAVGAAGDAGALTALAGACGLIDVDVVPLSDTPGLTVTRTVAMLATIAAEAAAAGVATPDDIDTAMRLGVNHPVGPFAWAEILGNEAVATTLAMLSEENPLRYQPVRTQ